MVFVKSVTSFLSLYISLALYAELAYGSPRDRRSPQWELSSPLLHAGQDKRNIWASVGGVNSSPNKQQSTSILGGLNTQSISVKNQQIPQISQDNGRLNQNLGSATHISPNAVSALPTGNNEKNQRARLGLGSQPLLGAGVNDGNTWLSVAGQNLVLTQSNKKPQQTAVQPVPNAQPNYVLQNPPTLSQQTGQKPQPAETSDSNSEDAHISTESRFSEKPANKEPQIVNYDPEMFQVKPVRPANEII